MKTIKMVPLFTVFFAFLAFFLCLPVVTYAHCDGLDGPVVVAAQKALESGNVNLVLIWVPPSLQGTRPWKTANSNRWRNC